MKIIFAIILLISSPYRTNSVVNVEHELDAATECRTNAYGQPVPLCTDAASEMRELVQRHTDLESKLNLEGVLATLVNNPIYEFHLTDNVPNQLRLEGKENTRQFYREHFDLFFPLIKSHTFISEHWEDHSAQLEFDVYLKPPYNSDRPYRLIVTLTEQDSLLIGESFQVESELAQLMAGTTFSKFKQF